MNLIPGMINYDTTQQRRAKRELVNMKYVLPKYSIMFFLLLASLTCCAPQETSNSTLSAKPTAITLVEDEPGNEPMLGDDVSINTRLTQTSPPNPTSSPSPTEQPPLVTLTPERFLLEGPLIAFETENGETGNNAILIMDTTTGNARSISEEQLDGTIVGFDWSSDGCNLSIALSSSGMVQYVETDLNGEIISLISPPILRSTEEGSRFAWTISSKQDWIAFLVGTGEDNEGFGFAFRDTWTIKNNDEISTPIAQTQNSWTLAPVWSPDGELLAFSKYDASGIPQLYHSAPDGSDLVQLTNFSEPFARINSIRWSPDSQWLTFSKFGVVNPLAPGESSLWSVTKDAQNIVQVELGDYIVRQSPWWSANSDGFSAYVELWSPDSSEGFQEGKIVWVNPQSGEITHEFFPTDIKFEHVFPVGGNNVIGFLGSNFTIYDSVNDTVTVIGDSPFGPLYPRQVTPLIGPFDFLGEDNCP